ncbi:MAG: NAD(+)/NADH kinase [Armatimonadota bacterium]
MEKRRRIKNVVIYPGKRPEILEFINKVSGWLKARNISVYMPADCAKFFNLKELSASDKTIFKNADVVLSLGGDGTFLRAARYLCGHDIGVLGINLGRKGFLTEISIEEIDEYLKLLIAGRYKVEKRMMLDCGITRDKKKVFSGTALNDVVMSKGSFEHLLKIKTYVNGSYAASFTSDGLIVSTPTGSTAYAVSAGGPIVAPGTGCIVMAAICPHTLSARPLIISKDDVVNIEEENVQKVDIIIDGQIKFSSLRKDKITVKKSSKSTKIIRIKKGFYEIIRDKLKWVE